MRKDTSSELMQIREQFVTGGRISNIEEPRFDAKLSTLIEHLQQELRSAVEVDPIEVLTIAMLFDPESGLERLRLGRVHVQPLLAKLFAGSVPMAKRLNYIPQLAEKGLLMSDRYCGKLAPEIARHYGFSGSTILCDDKVRLTDFAHALILGDQTTLRLFEGAPYESNVEFLNDWAELLEGTRHSSVGYWQEFEDRLGSMALVFRTKREYHRIMRRLEATRLPIPFRTLMQKHNLSQAEQIVLMHCVYHKKDENSAAERLEGPMLLLNDEQFYAMERPALSPCSRMARLGLFTIEKDPWGNEIRELIKISDDVYRMILGEAAWAVSRAILE